MEINLASPLPAVLNLAMLGVLAGCLVVIWNARHSVGLMVFANLFSIALGGVVIPIFAIAAAITITVTDRRAHQPPREHSMVVAVVLRHFRGRPDPVVAAPSARAHLEA